MRTLGATLHGVDGIAVEVEVRISAQLPRVDVVGLPETSVRESALRVRAALAAVGERFPVGRVTVNLAPAGLRKSGAGLDLPIALAVLCAAGEGDPERLTACGWLGELALDGRLRPVRGALSMVLALRRAGCREVVVPRASGPECALAPDVGVRTAEHLGEAVAWLREAGELPLAVRPEEPARDGTEPPPPCLSDVHGQPGAVRALEIAAAGGHGLLLRGPPGSGKTLLARRLPGVLPPLEPDEAIEVTRIHGAAGLLESAPRPWISRRPFRAPHASASPAGLLGGGRPLRPGEISLAHHGVLFLDELPEFDRRVLEALRQVLEERQVVIARAQDRCVLPADWMLVAACNPCPCGWLGDARRDCRCDAAAIERYRRRLSGPLLDRIDLHVAVPSVAYRDLQGPRALPAEASEVVRARVMAARRRQLLRQGCVNARLDGARLRTVACPDGPARALLERAAEGLALSARAVDRVLRVARTVADLAARPGIGSEAIAEAVSARAVDALAQGVPGADRWRG